MRKTWIGPLCMVAAALCCVLLGEWASHRILDEGSPVSFQTYQTQTQVEYRHLGEEPMDYWETYTGFFDDFPFYCTEEMLEEELQAIRQWSETKISPVSYEEANDAVVAAFAKYGVEGGLYPPEEGQAFFCTPVILDNTVRYIESVAQAQQQKETAGDGVYVNQ